MQDMIPLHIRKYQADDDDDEDIDDTLVAKRFFWVRLSTYQLFLPRTLEENKMRKWNHIIQACSSDGMCFVTLRSCYVGQH